MKYKRLILKFLLISKISVVNKYSRISKFRHFKFKKCLCKIFRSSLISGLSFRNLYKILIVSTELKNISVPRLYLSIFLISSARILSCSVIQLMFISLSSLLISICFACLTKQLMSYRSGFHISDIYSYGSGDLHKLSSCQ